MALIPIYECDKKSGSHAPYKDVFYSGDRWEVQDKFCFMVEHYDNKEEEFFEEECVKEYLGRFGVEYRGNFKLYFTDEDREVLFTHLNYPLQLGCLAVRTKFPVVITKSSLFYAKYIIPVLEQGKDVYIHLYNYTDLFSELREVVSAGIPVRVAGEEYTDPRALFDVLLDLKSEMYTLTREKEQRVYDMHKKSGNFKPYAEDFVRHFKRVSPENEREIDEYAGEHPECRDIVVRVNRSQLMKDSYFRKYPVLALYHIEKGWEYVRSISVKYPTYWELVGYSLLDPYAMVCKEQSIEYFEKADRVFVMIMDDEEVFPVDEFRQSYLISAEYDKAKKEIVIYDDDVGLNRFHELYQMSTDFEGE